MARHNITISEQCKHMNIQHCKLKICRIFQPNSLGDYLGIIDKIRLQNSRDQYTLYILLQKNLGFKLLTTAMFGTTVGSIKLAANQKPQVEASLSASICCGNSSILNMHYILFEQI